MSIPTISSWLVLTNAYGPEPEIAHAYGQFFFAHAYGKKYTHA